MARKSVTPPINARGSFTVLAPFDEKFDASDVWTVIAIRDFTDLERRDYDVYDDFYSDYEITTDDYDLDAAANASIITLKSSTEEIFNIPDTYIESYPGMNGLDYVHKVICFDIGMMPQSIDLSSLSSDLEDVVLHYTGVDSTAYIDTLEVTKAITQDQHVELEAARKAKLSSYVPLADQVATLTTKNQALAKQNAALTETILQLQKKLSS